DPGVIVVSGVIPERFVDAKRDLTALAADFRLAIGGAGAAPEIAEAIGAHYLGEDPVTAADALAAVR
ncbi:MAG: hypothetical protein KY396_06530, partial [Actinobacteria bacterium]|nr:hypothetical protein [Actinomycetota bacterium]